MVDAAVQIVGMFGGAAIAANLREAGDAGLDRVPLPIARLDVPEQPVARQAAERVGTRADDAHLTAQHVEHLRQFVDAGRADEAADAGDARVAALRRAIACQIRAIDAHAAEL